MVNKKIVLSLLVSAVLSADQKPISQAIVDSIGVFGTSIKVEKLDPKTSPNTISINTPVHTFKMLGGSTGTKTYSNDVKEHLERACLAYGGDVYFTVTDPYGDVVTKHSFNQELVSAMSPAERMKYLEPGKELGFAMNWFDMRKKLFTDDRLHRSFMFDTDLLRPESLYYNTTCMIPSTNQVLYVAKTLERAERKGSYDPTMITVQFSDPLPADFIKRKSSTKTIDDVFAGSILDTKGNKLIVGFVYEQGGLMNDIAGGVNEGKVQAYCENAGGTLYVDGTKYSRADRIQSFRNEIACTDINHPFTLTKYAGKYIISKDTAAMSIGNTDVSSENSSSSDPMKELAASVSTMPIGSTSENNIGNRKLVATVYAANNSSTLVNVQEAGNVSSLRNYQVSNGIANDITDPSWTFESISRLPKKMFDAKKALVNQCSAYGASQLSVDNYTAVCVRQGAGSSCLANMIYTRGNQFAGKESFGCNK
jgi:hypothetical protein